MKYQVLAIVMPSTLPIFSKSRLIIHVSIFQTLVYGMAVVPILYSNHHLSDEDPEKLDLLESKNNWIMRTMLLVE